MVLKISKVEFSGGQTPKNGKGGQFVLGFRIQLTDLHGSKLLSTTTKVAGGGQVNFHARVNSNTISLHQQQRVARRGQVNLGTGLDTPKHFGSDPGLESVQSFKNRTMCVILHRNADLSDG